MPLFCVFAFAKCASAQLECTPKIWEIHYGQPVKSTYDKNGLVFFHKAPLYYAAHFYQGGCDQVSVFSDTESMGVPIELTDQTILTILSEMVKDSTWEAVAAAPMNRLWNTKDGKYIAIYDTMRKKMAVVSYVSYKREKYIRKPKQ